MDLLMDHKSFINALYIKNKPFVRIMSVLAGC